MLALPLGDFKPSSPRLRGTATWVQSDQGWRLDRVADLLHTGAQSSHATAVGSGMFCRADASGTRDCHRSASLKQRSEWGTLQRSFAADAIGQQLP